MIFLNGELINRLAQITEEEQNYPTVELSQIAKNVMFLPLMQVILLKILQEKRLKSI